jgi:hypothetical protein
MRLAPHEYLIAGSGIVVEFATSYEHRHQQQTALGEDGFAQGTTASAAALPHSNPTRGKGKACRRLGIGYADEVSIAPEDGTLHFVRRDNGDQTHQGRHVRIGIDDYRILHVKLYEY